MDIITAILEIDRHAKQKIQNAYDEQNRIINDAAAEKVEIHNKLMDRANTRIQKVEKFEKESAEEKTQMLIANEENTVKELDEIYTSNHDTWENEIFNSIISTP
ncbi:MAG: hypothetical protein GX896_10635 [Clostridiales bacterium]|nr:hypothetical protein [Clostridiales bacterium]